MLLEKQKTIPNKMASNAKIPILKKSSGGLESTLSDTTENVIIALLILVSMLVIFPTVMMIIVLGHVGVFRVSTVLILSVLFVIFYWIIIYSIYQILRYYLNPLGILIDMI